MKFLFVFATLACAGVPVAAFQPSQVGCQRRRRALFMSGGTVLRPTMGGDEISIERDSTVELSGCKVEEKGGRYFCTSESGKAKIGSNTLTVGVSYGLNDNMRLTTDDGIEYELKMEGGGLPTERRDPTMGLVFDAMKAQFGVTDDE
jgi:hypothetical protein